MIVNTQTQFNSHKKSENTWEIVVKEFLLRKAWKVAAEVVIARCSRK